jgi:GNAT superfamily N-acetyltransferase
MQDSPVFRAATPADCSDLAVLFDAAARGITSWMWRDLAAPGQSWMEVGRDRIRTATEIRSHFAHWHVAELDGQTIGALFGFALPSPPEPVDWSQVPEVLRPLRELELMAHGCWMLQAAALFTEYRNRGLSRALLAHADAVARDSGAAQIVLQVEEVNQTACLAYRRYGYRDWARRPYVPFPGSDDSGEWIMMVKDL